MAVFHFPAVAAHYVWSGCPLIKVSLQAVLAAARNSLASPGAGSGSSDPPLVAVSLAAPQTWRRGLRTPGLGTAAKPPESQVVNAFPCMNGIAYLRVILKAGLVTGCPVYLAEDLAHGLSLMRQEEAIPLEIVFHSVPHLSLAVAVALAVAFALGGVDSLSDVRRWWDQCLEAIMKAFLRQRTRYRPHILRDIGLPFA